MRMSCGCRRSAGGPRQQPSEKSEFPESTCQRSNQNLMLEKVKI